MIRRTVIFSALAAGFSAPMALGQTTTAAKPGKAAPTSAFLSQAAVGNLFEIESSKLAQGKTKDSKVRQFADQMVKDHTDAGVKFKQAVGEAKLTPPAEKLHAKHAAIIEKLQKAEGSAFDKAYVEAQYQGHLETVALFEAYADGGDNARMKKFAQDMLPTLRTHLKHVQDLR